MELRTQRACLDFYENDEIPIDDARSQLGRAIAEWRAAVDKRMKEDAMTIDQRTQAMSVALRYRRNIPIVIDGVAESVRNYKKPGPPPVYQPDSDDEW